MKTKYTADKSHTIRAIEEYLPFSKNNNNGEVNIIIITLIESKLMKNFFNLEIKI